MQTPMQQLVCMQPTVKKMQRSLQRITPIPLLYNPMSNEGFYWSASRHSLAKQCECCFYKKYVLGIPYEHDDSVFNYGQKLHTSFETGKALEGEDLGRFLESEKLGDFVAYHQHLEQYADYAKRLRFSHDDLPEHRFRIALPNMSVPFEGVIDRLLIGLPPVAVQEEDAASLVNPKKPELRVWGWVDYKTRRQPWSQREIDEHIQFTFYWHWFVFKYLKEPRAFIMNFCKPSDTQAARVQVRAIKRTPEQCRAAVAEAEELYQRIVVRNEYNPVCANHFFCPYRTNDKK